MLISNLSPASLMLADQAPVYIPLSSATCSSLGCQEIASASTCEAAARSLAMWQWEGLLSRNGFPSLCFLYKGAGVYFNALPGQSCRDDEGAACICACPSNGTVASNARREQAILRTLFNTTNGPHWRCGLLGLRFHLIERDYTST